MVREGELCLEYLEHLHRGQEVSIREGDSPVGFDRVEVVCLDSMCLIPTSDDPQFEFRIR